MNMTSAMKQQFKAHLENLHEMLDFVKHSAALSGLHSNLLWMVELAAEEVIVNIIKHGFPQELAKEGVKNPVIEICCEGLPLEEGVQIIIKDQGIPFDPLLHAPPAPIGLTLETMPIGGFGVYLFRKMMDNASYRHINGSNELTLVKRNSP